MSGRVWNLFGFLSSGYFKVLNLVFLMDLEKLKDKLRSYSQEDIVFNEPHFSENLVAREGSRAEVIKNILNPDKLIGFSVALGKYGDLKYELYFRVNNFRTMILPVIFDKGGKNLYMLTYIMRYRI